MKKVVKSGRKINEEFESQVWGNLLLCIFEDKKEDASKKVLFLIFILPYLEIINIACLEYTKLISHLKPNIHR